MRRAARARRRCRRCPFFAHSGRCLDRTIKSGRCGDWVWYVRGGKQCRLRYARPRDPGTLAQLRSRGRLSAASRKYSHWLTDGQQDACIAAGAKLRSRPRLGQWGPLTGQQYLVRKEYARPKSQSKVTKTKSVPQTPQPQKVTQSTWEPRRGASGVAPEQRRRRQRVDCRRKKAKPSSQALQNQRVTGPAWRQSSSSAGAGRRRVAGPTRSAVAPPSHVWYAPRVTRNTVARHLQRSKARGFTP